MFLLQVWTNTPGSAVRPATRRESLPPEKHRSTSKVEWRVRVEGRVCEMWSLAVCGSSRWRCVLRFIGHVCGWLCRASSSSFWSDCGVSGFQQHLAKMDTRAWWLLSSPQVSHYGKFVFNSKIKGKTPKDIRQRDTGWLTDLFTYWILSWLTYLLTDLMITAWPTYGLT